ncbi:putative receptor-like protein kinase At3g47110 isoform X3 [Medicago truncatula]|uniref:putative receptor-like protein kinase At3g47110 isoform X3 n=1 Tax=Medicago truncatula TaxID=3880 RepID=UPI00196772C8|nr:putative receptor-like protein kinase At3g47110 isoform X3 [Medicago truncatula]
MKHFSFLLLPYAYPHLLLLLFTLTAMCVVPNRISGLVLGNQTDYLTLLQFKDSISIDPNGVLDSWNSSTHFCNWHGITCSPMHQRVIELNLQGYELHGSISTHIGNLSFLRNLNLAKNNFFGNIPNELGRLLQLQQLLLTNNTLSGEIPINLTHCSDLEGLYLRGNNLIGKIPIEITSLQKLQVLNIRNNKLTGSVSSFIGNLSSLISLSIGYNNLEGNIPKEVCRLKNLTGIIMFHNKLSAIYLRRKRNKKPSSDSPTIDQLPMVSYQDLYQATDGFSDRNLIGSGGFGSVYKGNLMSEDKVIAVKVLNLEKKGAHKSFITECNALKNIRHRNLVKILTCCSSIDNKGLEFKALVFEYMRNGSLEQWLHPGTMNADHPRTLKFEQRLNILVDVSSALHYLHHECEQLVLHCDLKPSNVLIDDDIVAHVSDFGIARLVSSADNNSCQETSTIGIKGTIGYAPPEYGMSSEVSTHGDMYSFGMLILEMLTGRRPTDDMFTDGQNLRLYVEISFPDNIMKILDPCIVPRVEEATIDDGSNRHLISTMDKCFVSIFRIGLACSMESPKERMNIEDATRELNIIRKTFLTGVHPHHKSKLK